jgi:hypothetical protein
MYHYEDQKNFRRLVLKRTVFFFLQKIIHSTSLHSINGI